MSPYLKQRLGNKLRQISLSRLAVDITALTLVECGHVKELSSKLRLIQFEPRKKLEDIDPSSFKDLYGYVDDTGRTRKGIAHKIFNSAEFGGRAASDLYDWASRRRAQAAESAQVGRFKVTENSPNTARITVGPGRRERRKKYTWERVGVQRQAALVGISAAVAGGFKLHKAIDSAGGIKNILGKVANRAKAVKTAVMGGPKIQPFVPTPTPEQTAMQQVAKQAASRAVAARSRKKTESLKYPHGSVMVPDPSGATHPLDHPNPKLRGKPKMKRVPLGPKPSPGPIGVYKPPAAG
jgi:hypothetical protein